jgi:hypothetical protein
MAQQLPLFGCGTTSAKNLIAIDRAPSKERKKNMFKKLAFAAFTLAAIGVSSAQAGPAILSFGLENGGNAQLNYFGFADYNVSQGSVDLIGNGSFDAYPGNGLYVDLAGSTGQFGAMTTKSILPAGTYDIVLSLGGPIYPEGNGFGVVQDGATVSWGEGPGQSFILNDLQTQDFFFTVKLLAPEQFTIADMGLSGNPNIGSTLFGFQISPHIASVPEPITLSLFGAGLAGAAAMRRRKKKTA